MKQGAGARNAHDLALKSGVSAATARKYAEAPGSVKFVDPSVLYRLFAGLGYTPESFLDLRIRDIFILE